MAQVNIDIAKETSVQASISAINSVTSTVADKLTLDSVYTKTNTIDSRIGTPDSVSDETVMGKLNEIKDTKKYFLIPSNTVRKSFPSLDCIQAVSSYLKISDNIYFEKSGIVEIKFRLKYSRPSAADIPLNFYYFHPTTYADGRNPYFLNTYLAQIVSPAGTVVSGLANTSAFNAPSLSSGTDMEISFSCRFAAESDTMTYFVLRVPAGTPPTALELTELKICYDEVVI